MLHHTTDPAQRAADIADREAKEIGDPAIFFDVLARTYDESLRELAGCYLEEDEPLSS